MSEAGQTAAAPVRPPRHVSVCRLCALVQHLPEMRDPGDAACQRCGSSLLAYRPKDLYRARSLVIAAAVLYLPANLLPIALVDYLGQHRTFTIIDGILHLYSLGIYSVGLLVTVTSFLTPMMKIVGLAYLSFAPPRARNLRGRRRVYDLIRRVNPWNATEICLLSMLVAMADFGRIASIEVGWGGIAFGAVVVLTTAASVVLDPAALRLGKASSA